MLPRFALLQHAAFIDERRHEMNVVRHHDEVGHLVPFAIEVQQTVGHDFREVRLAQDAVAMPFV